MFAHPVFNMVYVGQNVPIGYNPYLSTVPTQSFLPQEPAKETNSFVITMGIFVLFSNILFTIMLRAKLDTIEELSPVFLWSKGRYYATITMALLMLILDLIILAQFFIGDINSLNASVVIDILFSIFFSLLLVYVIYFAFWNSPNLIRQVAQLSLKEKIPQKHFINYYNNFWIVNIVSAYIAIVGIIISIYFQSSIRMILLICLLIPLLLLIIYLKVIFKMYEEKQENKDLNLSFDMKKKQNNDFQIDQLRQSQLPIKQQQQQSPPNNQFIQDEMI